LRCAAVSFRITPEEHDRSYAIMSPLVAAAVTAAAATTTFPDIHVILF
jgi:prephenate dehydrogenase